MSRFTATDGMVNAKKKRQEIFLAVLGRGATVQTACKETGIHEGTYQKWRQNEPWLAAKADSLKAQNGSWGKPNSFEGARKQYFGMETFPHQMRLVHALDDLRPREITLVNIWPEAGKSTTMVDYVCWVLANDPNHRFTIVAKSLSLGQKLLGRIKRRMTDTRQFPAFIARYGPFYEKGQERSGKPWSASGITVTKSDHDEADLSVEVRGWDSSAYGTRIDTLIIDDVQSIESLNDTERILASLRQTYFTRGRLMRILMVGTRLADGDIYERLLELEIVDRHIDLPALDVNGDPTVPEWWRGEDGEDPGVMIATLRKQVREDAWWASYMQKPNSNALATFTDEALNNAKDPLRKIVTFPRGEPIVIGLDPALGGGNAMVAVRLGAEEFKIIDCSVTYNLARVEEILNLLEEFVIRYRPSKVIIEVNAFQRSLANDERLRMMAGQYGFVTIPPQTGFNKVDAVLGVASMAGSFMREEISVPWGDDMARKRITPLLDELRRWRPNVPTKLLTQDLVMATWFCWRDWMRNRQGQFGGQSWQRAALPWRPVNRLALTTGGN